MRLGLTSLLLTLLILGGCSQEPTELERCIEANTEETNYWERYWESWNSIVDKFTEEEKKHYAESLEFPDWVWSEEEAIPKNDQDQRMLNCFNEKFDLEAFNTNFAKSKNITVEEVQTSGRKFSSMITSIHFDSFRFNSMQFISIQFKGAIKW